MIESTSRRPGGVTATTAQRRLVEAAANGHARLGSHPYVGGNSAELLVDAPNFMPWLVRDIRNAESLINLRFFGWTPEGTGAQLGAAVKQRLREGQQGIKPPVEVNIQVDRFGSQLVRATNRRFFQSLEQAGAHVMRSGVFPSELDRQFRYSSDHGKQAVIDGRIKYTGGINPAGIYDSWNDVMVRMEGPIASQSGLEYMARMADMGAPISDAHKAVLLRALANPQIAGGAEARVMANTPGGAKDLTAHVMEQIHGAKNRVWAQTPYIGLPDVPQALVDASHRGVDVRFAVPTPVGTESKIYLNRTFYPELLARDDNPVQLFEHRGMTHSKLLSADGTDTVMSLNLNNRSKITDHEIGVAIRDPKFSRQMRSMMESDFAKAARITSADVDSVGYRAAVLARRALNLYH